MTKLLTVDPELKGYLPELDRETKAMLEDSIKQSKGAREPIEVWKGKDIIVDGHNRYEICTRLDLPYTTRELEFDDKKAVKQHMLDVQISRRNLTREQASKFRGQYVKLLRGNRAADVAAGKPVSDMPVAEQAAADMNVAPATIKRDAQFVEGLETLEKVAPDEAKKVETGKSKINKGAIQKIGTAKGEAKDKAVETAMKQATRTHKKEVVEPKVEPKTEPKGAAAYGAKQITDAPDRDTGLLVEKLGLFFKAKTMAGRKQLIKQVAEALSKIEGEQFSVPPEYDSTPITMTPPPLKAMACDD